MTALRLHHRIHRIARQLTARGWMIVAVAAIVIGAIFGVAL